MVHRCLGCGKPITWSFAICVNCEKIYGNRTGTWPTWLRYMWADIQKERRRLKNSRNKETSLEYLTEGIGNDRDSD